MCVCSIVRIESHICHDAKCQATTRVMREIKHFFMEIPINIHNLRTVKVLDFLYALNSNAMYIIHEVK